MVMHASSNAASSLVTSLLPTDMELAGWANVLESGWINVMVFTLVAIVLVIFTRGTLGYRPHKV